jgi:hypothetical protein
MPVSQQTMLTLRQIDRRKAYWNYGCGMQVRFPPAWQLE